MIQIIGKGGMSRELQSYFKMPSHSIFLFENDEIKSVSPKFPTYIAIGDGYVRKKIAESHPHLYYPAVNFGVAWDRCILGAGTIVCAGASITTDVETGWHCLLNKNCSVSHDVKMGDYVTISPGAVICGNVKIRNNVFIGANATVIEKVTICSDVIIGAGAVVIRDILFPGTYVGNPARHITFH